MQQSILQCTIRIPRCRMDHKSRGLIHHDDGIVFVPDREGNMLRPVFDPILQVGAEYDGFPAG